MLLRPRHYAANIIALIGVEERRAALATVPSEFRGWVQDLVESHFLKKAYYRQYQAKKERLHRLNKRASFYANK